MLYSSCVCYNDYCARCFTQPHTYTCTQSPWDNLKKAVKAWSPFAVQFKKKCYPWVQLAGHKGMYNTNMHVVCNSIMGVIWVSTFSF